jgi:hypothetical protein
VPVEALPELLLEALPELLLEPLPELLLEPQAASASASTRVPMSAASPRTCGVPPFRRSSFEWDVIHVSFGDL